MSEITEDQSEFELIELRRPEIAIPLYVFNEAGYRLMNEGTNGLQNSEILSDLSRFIEFRIQEPFLEGIPQNSPYIFSVFGSTLVVFFNDLIDISVAGQFAAFVVLFKLFTINSLKMKNHYELCILNSKPIVVIIIQTEKTGARTKFYFNINSKGCAGFPAPTLQQIVDFYLTDGIDEVKKSLDAGDMSIQASFFSYLANNDDLSPLKPGSFFVFQYLLEYKTLKMIHRGELKSFKESVQDGETFFLISKDEIQKITNNCFPD